LGTGVHTERTARGSLSGERASRRRKAQSSGGAPTRSWRNTKTTSFLPGTRARRRRTFRVPSSVVGRYLAAWLWDFPPKWGTAVLPVPRRRASSPVAREPRPKLYTYTAADMLFSTGPLWGQTRPERPPPLALRAHLRCGGGPTFSHCLELVWLSCARSPAPGASRSLRYSVCLGPRPRPRTPNLH
jgi:hypothetical protein